jgi:hypothetical protein
LILKRLIAAGVGGMPTAGNNLVFWNDRLDVPNVPVRLGLPDLPFD